MWVGAVVVEGSRWGLVVYRIKGWAFGCRGGNDGWDFDDVNVLLMFYSI